MAGAWRRHARTEQRGPDTQHRCTFVDRPLPDRHSSPSTACRARTVRVHALKQVPQLVQPVPLPHRIFFGWWQAHQSAQPQPRQRRDSMQQLPQGARCDAALAALGADMDLYADIQGRCMEGPLFRQPLGDAQPVDAMDPREVLGHGAGLVRLQRADEVPGGCRLTRRRQHRHLGQRVPHVAFPKSRNPALRAAPSAATGCPLLAPTSVIWSTLRPDSNAAARIRARIRARFSAKGCGGGEFCGSINIWDSQPLRYTRSAFFVCFAPLTAASGMPVCVAPAVPRGTSMAVDIAQLLAFAVKNSASDLHLSRACRR